MQPKVSDAGRTIELLVHDCDLDTTRFGKETVFDFARHRRIEHYGLIATQIGVEPPKAP